MLNVCMQVVLVLSAVIFGIIHGWNIVAQPEIAKKNH